MSTTEGLAGLFLAVIAFAALRAARDGELGQWVAAKFLNAGELAPAPVVDDTNFEALGIDPDTGADNTDPASGSKQFGDPVPSAQLVSPFGVPRDGGARTHKGIDLAAPRNTPINAIAGGTVRYAKPGMNLCGTGVKIDHGGGWESLYCHLEGTAVQTGGTVRRGDKIGTVGNSGNARTTGPHLHFEIHRNGVAVNPRALIGR